MNSFNVEITPNGNLKLTLTSQRDRDDLAELMDYDHWSEFDCLWHLLEPWACNGGYYPFDAGQGNPFVGLTDAPCIAEEMAIYSDGVKEVIGRCWWHPNYAAENCMETLARKGEFVFTLAE